jgi:prophage antirepressor-like protein
VTLVERSIRLTKITNLTTFNYLSNTVRVVEIDGQPWFVATDLYRILYGRTTGLTNNITELADDERRVVRKSELSVSDTLTSLFTGTRYQIALLSESALYKLVMRSDKPAARQFQDWVTREVLPAIRKDGMYVAGEEKLKTGGDLSCPTTIRFFRGLRIIPEKRSPGTATKEVLSLPRIFVGMNWPPPMA